MGTTTVGTGSTLTVKQYQQNRISEEALKFNTIGQRGFMGDSANNILVVENALSKDAGDSVDYYLEMNLQGAGVGSNETARGNEEQLVYHNDTLKIDERFHSVLIKGKMTDQRTRIKLRKRAPRALGRWGGEWLNELFWTMITGERGTNNGKLASNFTGFAGNTLTVADSDHVLYGGDATSKASIDATDKFDLTLIEKNVTKAETLSPQVMPISLDGDNKWMMGIHPYSARDLRTNTNNFQWADFQKAVTQGGGKGLYTKNALGEHADTILFKSQDVRTFSDFGAGSNVAGVANVFFGAQAGVIAYGKGYEGAQWNYVEITEDYERETGFGTGIIVGIKPCIFNSKRFGMIVNYCAAAA